MIPQKNQLISLIPVYRFAAISQPQVPFSNNSGMIPRSLKQLWNGIKLSFNNTACISRQNMCLIIPERITPCQNAEACRRTNRRGGICVGNIQSLLHIACPDSGGVDLPCSIASKIPKTKIIGINDYNILLCRFFHSLFSLSEHNKQSSFSPWASYR